MKTPFLPTAAMLAAAVVASGSLSAADPPKPRPSNPQGSPELLEDGRVTFRFRSKNAKKVEAGGQFGPAVTLAKGEGDMWVGTTAEPVKPGVFEYHLTVDGQGVIDPLNPEIKPQRWPGSSILHVPANPPAPWDLQDIPHGTVHVHDYHSPSLGTWRKLVVYTPPGVTTGAAAEPLPVLYLSHGFSDNEATWTVHGRAHWILDSLIAQQKAVPMIIVMPDGHALPPGGGWKEDYGTANTDAYCKELVEEVIPLVEKNYPVKKDAAARAFAGLSMGGRHALTVALRHSDTFSWIGAFSAAPPDAATTEMGFKQADGINGRLKLLWIGCGKKDFLFQRNEEFHAAADKAGLRHEFAVTEGDHSWPIWRGYLAGFAPRLFR